MKLDKTADRPVIGFLYGIREIAGGEFPVCPMVGNTLTTDPFSGTGIVRAVAMFHIIVFIGTFILFCCCQWTVLLFPG